MAGRWCTVVVLVLVLYVRDGLPAGEPGSDQDVSYLEDVQLIRIHMPLEARDWGGLPCPAPGQGCDGRPDGVAWYLDRDCTPSSTTITTTATTTTTTTPDTTTPSIDDDDVLTTDDVETADIAPVDEDPAATTAYPPKETVIPDVATVDVFFSNESVLNNMVTSFGFSGVYEVVANRTERSVEVTLTRLDEDMLAMEVPPEPVDLVVRGPTITGINGPDGDDEDDDDDDEDADAEFAVNADDDDDGAEEEYDEEHEDAKPELSDDTDGSDDASSVNVTMLGHPRHRAHPIYISGTALNSDQLCNIAFNVSGAFQLNRTITERTTTVIITQLSLTTEPETHTDRLLTKTAESTTSGGVGTATILSIMGVSALLVLLGAIIVTAIRRSRRRDAIIQEEDNNGYGTIESPSEAWRYYETF